MFRNIQDFISLIGSKDRMTAYKLVEDHSEEISSLFKTAGNVIQLTRTGYLTYQGIGGAIACRLISKQSVAMARLFENPEQLMLLVKAHLSSALALINSQSKMIAILFDHAEEFTRLASDVDFNIACALIYKQPWIICSLYKSHDDLQKLIEKNKVVADILLDMVKITYSNFGRVFNLEGKVILLSNAQHFIALAGSCDYGQAIKLIKEKSEDIVSLFSNADEVIQLASASKLACLELITLQSRKIANLFNNANEFIKFVHEADTNVTNALIYNQGDIILTLFKNKDDILKLEQVDKQAAATLLIIAKQCFSRTTSLLNDIFPPAMNINYFAADGKHETRRGDRRSPS